MTQKRQLWPVLLLLPFLSFSQLNVTISNSANGLAQNIGGNGVTVSNASINCGANGAGSFTYTGGSLGIPSGIVLTTGDASQVANNGNFFMSTLNGNSFSDPDLTNIDPQAYNDVCILEFDFVPICNSISVTFVFGSEEYPAFVNSSFNDAFGIFLTGPNPGGGSYNSQNVGTLPNTTPVSINNVNASTNSAYFYDNYTAPNNDIAFGGYTIPITSVSQVVPCSTYHMKIAIADAGDQAYDSGVFVGNNAVSCANAPAITATATPTGCGGNTGTAAVTVTNYTGAVTYQWTPGGQTTSSISGLAAGTYSCAVGLALSCGTITQTVTAIVVNTGVTLTLTATSTNPSCNGYTNGTATVTASGGSAPYTYNWNTTPVQTSATVSNLSPGQYTVTVTDNGGCVGTATVSLTNPVAIVTTVTTTPTTCSGSNGTAGVNITSGGVAPFSYAWSTAPVQTTQVATGLPAGTYTVVVMSANTCTAMATGIVNQQNGGWTLTASTATNVSCFGGNNGAATFVINTPGANVFTYLWNTTPAQTTQIASNLSSGTYTCSVSDANGCTQTVSVTVTQPAQLTATTSVAPTICTASIGSATVTAAGGTSPYTYAWNTTPAQATAVANNMPAGSFNATVTDSKGCTVVSSAVIGTTIQTIQAAVSSSPSKCGGPSGSATVGGLTGTSPYTFSWNSTPVQTTQNLNNVVPGNYTLSIIDKNGCTGSFPINVGITTGLPLTIATTPDICYNSVGSATITAAGQAPYTYTWNTVPATSTQALSSVPAGNYFVVVRDNNGCKDSTFVTIGNVNESLTTNFYTNPNGEMLAEESVTMLITANTGWTLDSALLSDGNLSFNSNNLVHTFNQHGLYYASYWFTSTNGCRDSVIYPIKISNFMTLYFPNAFSPNGDGLNDIFKAQGTFIKSFEMNIYDRWGQLVLRTDDINKGWDGIYRKDDAPQDTYVYKGKAVDVFGKLINFQGQVNLVR